jgi:hypothetical protein
VIRSAVEATGLTPSSFKEWSQTDSGSRGEAIQALLDSLKGAQQHDEGHRRSEIERVMQSAARWGAEMARKRPNDPDGWEPAVMWNDHGEPEIVAIRGPANQSPRRTRELRLRRERHETRQANYVDARDANALAEREALEANRALSRASEPSAELRERATNAKQHVNETRDHLDSISGGMFTSTGAPKQT